jgi:DegV family protein with EDD domain
VSIRIVTDSTADIPDDVAAELRIGIIPAYINFGTESLRDKIDISRPEFYRRLATESVVPTTASPGVGEFEESYRAAGAPEATIVSIHPPARLSALYGTAMLAARSFPAGQVTIVDSGQITMGMGWQVIAAARAARENAPLETILDLVKATGPRSRVFAALDTFEYLRRSGRVGWAKMVVGTLLRIKPMIEFREGEILPLDRVRTSQRALARLVELSESLMPLDSLAILHSNWPEGAEELRRHLTHVRLIDPLLVVDVTPVIGVHVGPRGLGVAVVHKARQGAPSRSAHE